MLEKFLHEVVSIIAGSSADKLVGVLYGKQNVNEFLIAKKLSLTINQTRNILYKLVDEGLVYFNRKKDSKSGGWYTYFWTMDSEKCLIYYRDRLLKEITQIEGLLNTKKTTRFYFCKTCGVEMSEEHALLQEFTCSECGTVFEFKDSSNNIKEVERQILRLKTKVAEVQIDLDVLIVARQVKSAKKEALNKKVSKKKPVKKKVVSSKKKPVKKKVVKSKAKPRKK